jgi:DNA polymerase-3 subunit gamma/tau
MQADDEALELVAKRAGGSMRDAQSLLDQLLAFGGERLMADQVHKLLGTAAADQVAALAAAVMAKDVTQALDLLARALDGGAQPGELLDQLIDYWRDLMLVGCGGADVVGLNTAPRQRDTVRAQAAAATLDTVLAGLDILSATKARLRGTGHGRVLMEMAIVRLSRLDDLISLSQIAQILQSGHEPTAVSSSRPVPAGTPVAPTSPTRTVEPPEAGKKKSPEASHGQTPLTPDTLAHVWAEILTQVGPILARELDRGGRPAISGPNALVLQFPAEYSQQRDYCTDPPRLQRVLDALKRVTGQEWTLRLETRPARNGPTAPSPAAPRPLEPTRHPLVQRVADVLDAKLVQLDDGFGQVLDPAGNAPTDTEE